MAKRIITFLVVIVMTVIFSTTAFAGGHHGSRTAARTTYTVCADKYCTITTAHYHNSHTSAHH